MTTDPDIDKMKKITGWQPFLRLYRLACDSACLFASIHGVFYCYNHNQLWIAPLMVICSGIFYHQILRWAEENKNVRF